MYPVFRIQRFPKSCVMMMLFSSEFHTASQPEPIHQEVLLILCDSLG